MLRRPHVKCFIRAKSVVLLALLSIPDAMARPEQKVLDSKRFPSVRSRQTEPPGSTCAAVSNILTRIPIGLDVKNRAKTQGSAAGTSDAAESHLFGNDGCHPVHASLHDSRRSVSVRNRPPTHTSGRAHFRQNDLWSVVTPGEVLCRSKHVSPRSSCGSRVLGTAPGFFSVRSICSAGKRGRPE